MGTLYPNSSRRWAAPRAQPGSQPNRAEILGAAGDGRLGVIIKLRLEYIWVCVCVCLVCLAVPVSPSEFIPLGTKASRKSSVFFDVSPRRAVGFWRAEFGLRSAAVIWNEVDRQQGWARSRSGRPRRCSVRVAAMVSQQGSRETPQRPSPFVETCHVPVPLNPPPAPNLPSANSVPDEPPVAGMPGEGEQRPGWPFGMPSQKFRPPVSAVALLARCRPRLAPSGLAWRCGGENRLNLGMECHPQSERTMPHTPCLPCIMGGAFHTQKVCVRCLWNICSLTPSPLCC